jgi:hypothetical protein
MNIWTNLQKKDAQRAYEVDIKQPLKTPSKLLLKRSLPETPQKQSIIPTYNHEKNN